MMWRCRGRYNDLLGALPPEIHDNMKLKQSKKIIPPVFTFVILATFLFVPITHAAVPSDTVNLNDKGFNFIVCDGPKLPPNYPNKPSGYRDCDFYALMVQAQKLINIAMVVGVFVAIAGFCYMGYLFMTGKEDDRKKGIDIFPKIFFGFIIMLSAWFIVYQLLSWLTGNNGFKALLGSP